MKKNLLSIIILALLIVNIVLTAIMMFSVVGASKKTSQLVTDIASVLKLELEGGPDGSAVRDVPLSQTEVYNVPELTVAMRAEEGVEGTQYCLVSIVLSIDTKAKGYKDYGSAETMESYSPLISSEINTVLGSYTVNELKSPAAQDEAKARILASLQKMFDSDFIYNVSISDIKFS